MSQGTRRLQRAAHSSGNVVPSSVGIAQSASGSWNGTSFTVSLPQATAPSSVVVLMVAGNSSPNTPNGFTLRQSQVNWLAHHCYTAVGGGTSWSVTAPSSIGTWWVAELTGVSWDTGVGANTSSVAGSIATPVITPAAGDGILIASLGSTTDQNAIRTVSGWTNGFIETADLCVATNDYPSQALAYQIVSASGSTSYDTSGTFSIPSFGRSALLVSFSSGHAVPDTIAPTQPANLVATPAAHSVALTWDASTDNVALAGYEYSLDDTTYTTTGSIGTSYTVSGLSAATSYTLYLRAFDAAGNRSTAASVSATTLASAGFTGTKVAIIGDSLTWQAGGGETAVPAAFTDAGWPVTAPNVSNPTVGTWFYGWDGKKIAEADSGGHTTMQNIAQCRASAFGEPDVWVIALCSNDGGDTAEQIKASMQLVFDELGPNAKLLWVNMGAQAAGPNTPVVNAAIAEKLATRPHSMLADWNTIVATTVDQSGWWTDGVHMTPAGYAVRNNFIAQRSIDAFGA